MFLLNYLYIYILLIVQWQHCWINNYNYHKIKYYAAIWDEFIYFLSFVSSVYYLYKHKYINIFTNAVFMTYVIMHTCWSFCCILHKILIVDRVREFKVLCCQMKCMLLNDDLYQIRADLRAFHPFTQYDNGWNGCRCEDWRIGIKCRTQIHLLEMVINKKKKL